MLQTVGPQEDPGMRKIILADIARLRKMPDLAKQIEEYQPEPDPLQQRLQELEIAKVEAELAELQSQVELNKAKVQAELAKAKQYSSNADLKDLDFIEQESGVKQERDLQKQGAQARAQAQMKVLEHQLAKNQPKQ